MGTSLDNTAILPICIADKPKWRKQTQNVFVDDGGFPDKTEHYKNLLRYVNGGPILRKPLVFTIKQCTHGTCTKQIPQESYIGQSSLVL
jgi:hypothetical protein